MAKRRLVAHPRDRNKLTLRLNRLLRWLAKVDADPQYHPEYFAEVQRLKREIAA
jgi:hypothetical protein